jgi:hypothetical protein
MTVRRRRLLGTARRPWQPNNWERGGGPRRAYLSRRSRWISTKPICIMVEIPTADDASVFIQQQTPYPHKRISKYIPSRRQTRPTQIPNRPPPSPRFLQLLHHHVVKKRPCSLITYQRTGEYLPNGIGHGLVEGVYPHPARERVQGGFVRHADDVARRGPNAPDASGSHGGGGRVAVDLSIRQGWGGGRTMRAPRVGGLLHNDGRSVCCVFETLNLNGWGDS